MINFDKWYDNKIIEITKMLPDVNTYHSPIIECPISFSELQPIVPIESIKDMPDTMITHTIRFEKILKDYNYEWKRI